MFFDTEIYSIYYLQIQSFFILAAIPAKISPPDTYIKAETSTKWFCKCFINAFVSTGTYLKFRTLTCIISWNNQRA